MSHFSFLYQGIHKYKRQQLAVFFILNNQYKHNSLSNTMVVFLATMSSFNVDFIDFRRHFQRRSLAPLNGVYFGVT
jgi:hypothetical protein